MDANTMNHYIIKKFIHSQLAVTLRLTAAAAVALFIFKTNEDQHHQYEMLYAVFWGLQIFAMTGP